MFIHSYLEIFSTPIVHVGLLISLVLKSLGLIHHVDIVLFVIEGLVLRAPLEVAVVDPLGVGGTLGRQHHAGAWPGGQGARGNQGGVGRRRLRL